MLAIGDCCNYDPVKSYIRVEDQLPTVFMNAIGLLEGTTMIEHVRGGSFQGRIKGPAMVALGHGLDEGIGIGPDFPGIFGMLNW